MPVHFLLWAGLSGSEPERGVQTRVEYECFLYPNKLDYSFSTDLGYLSCGFGVSRFNKSFPSDLRIKSSALRCLTQPFQFIALQSKALWPRCTLYSHCQNSRKKDHANKYVKAALYQCCVWAQSAGEASQP